MPDRKNRQPGGEKIEKEKFLGEDQEPRVPKEEETREDILTPEKQTEIEERKAEIEREVEKVKTEEEVPKEEAETVEKIIKKARENKKLLDIGTSESMAKTLADLAVYGDEKVANVIRAAKQFGDPYFFDILVTELTTDEAWKKLRAGGKL